MVQNRKKKHRIKSNPIINCSTSEEVSERANQWAQRSARAKRVGWSKWMSEQCTVGQINQEYLQTEELGHSLIRSLICWHHSLVRLLCTACFAHSLAYGTVNNWMAIVSVFFAVLDHSVLVSPHDFLLYKIPWLLHCICFVSLRKNCFVLASLIQIQ